MPNISKIKELAPIFGAAQREPKAVNLEDLKDVNVGFDSYQIQPGETLKFPKLEEMEFRSQPVRAGQDEDGPKSYLVACEKVDSTGKTVGATWLNLGMFRKQKYVAETSRLEYVYPEWQALGNAKAQVAMLAQIGELKAAKDGQLIQVYDWNRDGSPKYQPVFNEDGTPAIDVDGAPKLTRALRPQTVAVLETKPAK